jgi:hypothetical protein
MMNLVSHTENGRTPLVLPLFELTSSANTLSSIPINAPN